MPRSYYYMLGKKTSKLGYIQRKPAFLDPTPRIAIQRIGVGIGKESVPSKMIPTINNIKSKAVQQIYNNTALQGVTGSEVL